MTPSLKSTARSILSVSLLSVCSVVSAKAMHPKSLTVGAHQSGKVSYYSDHYQGRRTASGERYDRTQLTTTHPSLPFGSRVRVTNLSNHKSVVLRVIDRARPHNGRLLDVSRRAAQTLDFIRAGQARVQLDVLSLGG